MKAVLLATALFLLPSALYAQNLQPTETPPQTSQAQIIAKACGDKKKSEVYLDYLYKRIAKQYDYDKVFVKYLETSQQAWIAYRDAQLNLVYPPEYRASYGSVRVSCECSKMVNIINARIKELNQWLAGAEQGDVCTGSIIVNKK